jgi:hypothetical protein
MRNTRRVRGNLMKKARSPRLARDDAGLSLDSGFWQFPIQMKHGRKKQKISLSVSYTWIKWNPPKNVTATIDYPKMAAVPNSLMFRSI